MAVREFLWYIRRRESHCRIGAFWDIIALTVKDAGKEPVL